MLYLSRLLLNARSSRVRRDLAQCQELHRTLLRAFPTLEAKEPNAGARDQFGVLYRVEAEDRGTIPVLVQSTAEPDWSFFSEAFLTYLVPGVADAPNPAVKQIDGFYGRLGVAQEYVFRLRANPTRRISAKNTKEPARWHGKRVTFHHERDQLSWLARKGEQGGFALMQVQTQPIADVRTNDEHIVTGQHRRFDADAEKSRHDRMTFGSVLFEGRLRIVDAEQFRTTLVNGIGSGKAYGFGLLSIAAVGGGGV